MSGRMLQHDDIVGGRHGWTSGEVLLLQQQPPLNNAHVHLYKTAGPSGFLQPHPAYYNRPHQASHHPGWPAPTIDSQLEALSRHLQSRIQQLIGQGFNESEARLSLLRHRFNVEAASDELHHAAFMRKLQRASQTRAELGYTRSDVYKCGHKCLQRYQPCLPSIIEARNISSTTNAVPYAFHHERVKSSFN